GTRAHWRPEATDKRRNAMLIATLRLLITFGLTLGVWSAPAWAAPEAICTQPYILLCENFEDRPLGQFQSLPPSPSTFGSYIIGLDLQGGAIDAAAIVNGTGQFFDGTQGLQFFSRAGYWDGTSLQMYLLSTNREVWHRWYTKWGPEWSTGWPLAGVKHNG